MTATDSVFRWEQISAGRWAIKSPKKKKPYFSFSGRRTNILHMSSDGFRSFKTGILWRTLYFWKLLRVYIWTRQALKVAKRSAGGLQTKYMRRVATSWGRAARQWWNLVREVVTCLIANWRNLTYGESVQKMGNLMETLWGRLGHQGVEDPHL